MIEFLTDLGISSWATFWVPVLIWSVVALVTVLLLRTVPKRQTRLHLDVRIALLIALPIGLLIANLLLFAPNGVTYIFVVPAPDVSAVLQSVSAAPVETPFGAYAAIGALTSVVLLLSTIGIIRLTWSYFSLRRLVQSAVPFEPEDPQITVSRNHLNVAVLVNSDTPVAFSCGIFKKRIVLPVGGEYDQHLVLLHEMIHHDDGDVLRASVGQVVASLFFFHPLVHIVNRETRLFTELSCDQRVLRQSGTHRTNYALLLVRYAVHARINSTLALSMADTRSNLYKRIHAMKTPTRNAFSHRVVFVVAAFVLGAGVFFAACTESVLVASNDEGIEEYDIFARSMELPVLEGQDVFVIVETPPKLIGGLAGLQQAVVYPEVAREAGIQGRVFLQFIIQPDGSTSDIVVTRGIGGGCDEEAVRVLREARFIPGVQDGRRVPVKMSIPFTFKLKNASEGSGGPPPPDFEAFDSGYSLYGRYPLSDPNSVTAQVQTFRWVKHARFTTERENGVPKWATFELVMPDISRDQAETYKSELNEIDGITSIEIRSLAK